MAVPAIDATFGGATANSYVTQAEATSYFELRPGGQKFLDENGETQRRFLIFATKLIDRETFWRGRSGTTQILEFPRAGMDAIPIKVKEAQLEQALDFAVGGYERRLRQIELQSLGVRETTADGVQVRMVPSHPDALQMFRLCGQARHLLQEYVEMAVIVGRA